MTLIEVPTPGTKKNKIWYPSLRNFLPRRWDTETSACTTNDDWFVDFTFESSPRREPGLDESIRLGMSVEIRIRTCVWTLSPRGGHAKSKFHSSLHDKTLFNVKEMLSREPFDWERAKRERSFCFIFWQRNRGKQHTRMFATRFKSNTGSLFFYSVFPIQRPPCDVSTI